MAPSDYGLTALQKAVLSAFFAVPSGFFLTGEGALVGFHGFPRHTDDLDLFTTRHGDFEHLHGLALDVARTVEATCSPLQATPTFRRYLFAKGDESVRVDFVLEPVAQLHDEKDVRDGVRVDPLDEILANKICSLVGRSAARDFWDIWQLVERGLSFEDGLRAAETKDGGVTPEGLVVVLSDVDWRALRLLGEREGLFGWDKIEPLFRDLAQGAALGLLPNRAGAPEAPTAS